MNWRGEILALDANRETTEGRAHKKETAENIGASAASSRNVISGKYTSRRLLFFVAVKAVGGRDGAEEAVLLTVRTSGEEQSVGRAGSRIIAKREGPQSINGHDGIIRILHEADEF